MSGQRIDRSGGCAAISGGPSLTIMLTDFVPEAVWTLAVWADFPDGGSVLLGRYVTAATADRTRVIGYASAPGARGWRVVAPPVVDDPPPGLVGELTLATEHELSSPIGLVPSAYATVAGP